MNIIDPEGKYEEIVNRYANQTANICDGDENTVELINGDYYRFTIIPETLKELNIEYLFSPVDYTDILASHGISCTFLFSQDGYTIYHLEY